MFRPAFVAAGILSACLSFCAPARAEGPVIPSFFDARERLPEPDLSQRPRIRFLITLDFPPFSFAEPSGGLAGFNVDLARLVCRVLAVEARCQIQALPWQELQPALAAGRADALLAGVAVTAESRGKLAFSRPYLRFPARFVARLGTKADPAALRGSEVGVIAQSAHAAMLRDLFPDIRPKSFETSAAMLQALREGKVTAAFGDGMRLGFWIGGTDSAGCCGFLGGPYVAPEYLGAGMTIAVRPDDAELAAAFDYALQKIEASGAFAELYLRYFPTGFF